MSVALTSSTLLSPSRSALGSPGKVLPFCRYPWPQPTAHQAHGHPSHWHLAAQLPQGPARDWREKEHGYCRVQMRKENAEQGLIPPHLHSLISGDQLCSLHPTNLAVRFSLCSGMPGMLPGCALLFLQEEPAPPRTSATLFHPPE